MELSKKGEKAKKELLQFGFNEDELEVLFKTEEELLAFYAAQQSAKTAEISEEDDDDESEPEPEDDFRLSPEQERAVTEAEHKRKLEEQRAEFEKVAPESKDEAPPDFDDFLKSLEEGMNTDNKDVPNN